MSILNFNFGFGSVGFMSILTGWFDYEQPDVNLSAAGLDSGSSFVNLISPAISFLIVGILHIPLLILYK